MVGSEYNGYIDDIEISGGELLTVATGSCCLADAVGTCIENMMEAACTQIAGAEYNGDGTTCATARCGGPEPAARLQGCVADKTQVECEDAAPAGLDGVFQGIGSTCQAGMVCCQEPFCRRRLGRGRGSRGFRRVPGVLQRHRRGRARGLRLLQPGHQPPNEGIERRRLRRVQQLLRLRERAWTQALAPSCVP